MIVAQHPGWRLRDQGLKRLAPERAERRACLVIDGGAQPRQVPIEQELGLDQECLQVVTGNFVFEMRCDRQRAWELPAVQIGQHVDRGLVALDDWRWWIDADQALLAQVFDPQESLL